MFSALSSGGLGIYNVPTNANKAQQNVCWRLLDQCESAYSQTSLTHPTHVNHVLCISVTGHHHQNLHWRKEQQLLFKRLNVVKKKSNKHA